MPRALVCALLLAVVASVTPLTTQAGKAPKPVDCVRLAQNWDAAIAEAKLLNVPIVLHSHKFT